MLPIRVIKFLKAENILTGTVPSYLKAQKRRNFFPQPRLSVTETGYLVGKAGPLTPDRGNSILGY